MIKSIWGVFWKALIVGFASIIAAKLVNKISKEFLMVIYQNIIVDFWPEWLGLVVFIFAYFYFSAKEKRIDNQKLSTWITHQGPHYQIREFNSLEDKINYLIGIKLDPMLKELRQINEQFKSTTDTIKQLEEMKRDMTNFMNKKWHER